MSFVEEEFHVLMVFKRYEAVGQESSPSYVTQGRMFAHKIKHVSTFTDK